MGAPKDESFLPEDLEKKLIEAENHIVSLNRQIRDLDTAVVQKTAELTAITKDTNTANIELERVTALYVGKNKAMDDRELRLNQMSDALVVRETALAKKEKQVNRYIAIFENMKNVIKSD